jgi:hypothetical protein
MWTDVQLALLLKAVAESLRNDVVMMQALTTNRELSSDLRLRITLTIKLVDEIDATARERD